VRRFVLGWDKLGLRQSLGSRIVIYADDLVILCRRGKAEEALHWMRELMGKLKLTDTHMQRFRKGSSTSWGSRSDGCIHREPARHAWRYGHRRKASGA
jgi:hypothetical protein